MMDLGTVKKKLEKGKYHDVSEAADDIRLVWKNCMTRLYLKTTRRVKSARYACCPCHLMRENQFSKRAVGKTSVRVAALQLLVMHTEEAKQKMRKLEFVHFVGSLLQALMRIKLKELRS